MAKKTVSKRLVIDASIARAAGGRPHPTSQHCTDFLETVRDEGHQMVMTPAIYGEWSRHEARFAYRWRTSMVASKKIVFLRRDDVVNPALREQIDQLDVTDKARQEMLKDVHLIEAALITDQTITSLNEQDRRRFASVCDTVTAIRAIIWVNPDRPEERCVEWLKNGSPPEKHRQPGYTIPE